MEDARIVQLYWNRDQAAISQTAAKYGGYCTSIARNILGNAQDAEECVNDTYLNAWNAMPPHRPSILATFLGKITRNLSFNRYKRQHAEKRGAGELPLVLEELGECVSGREDVEQEIAYRELVMTLEAFLQTLSVKKRRIFLRRYWYTDSVSDIAKCFGMRENAVSMVLARMRQELRSFLEERGYVL